MDFIQSRRAQVLFKFRSLIESSSWHIHLVAEGSNIPVRDIENFEECQFRFSVEAIMCASCLKTAQNDLDEIKALGFSKKKIEKECEKLRDEFFKYCEESYNISRATLLSCMNVIKISKR